MNEFDPIIEALEESARKLDANPGSVPTPEFRARCRKRLAQAASRGGWRQNLPVSRRLVAVGLAACLSILLVVPAMAGPGGVSGTMASVSNGVRHMFSSPATPDELMSDPANPSGSTDAIPRATSMHPANHGADVSTVAKETPEPGQNHGEQVRQFARDNYGHNKATETATATATATETAEQEQTSDDHGTDLSTAAQSKPDTNHGSDVSDAAHATPEAGENHGQKVRTVAEDNHGHEVSSEAHGKSTRMATPETSSSTTQTTTPETSPPAGSSNSKHGDGNGHGGD